MSVLEGNVRDEKSPCQPTLRRAAMESVRQIIQAIKVIGQPVQKHAWCIVPSTLRKSQKY